MSISTIRASDRLFNVVMRGDIARLGRCTSIVTQGEDTIKRSKPFKYAYEKEIVMYAATFLSNGFTAHRHHRYAYFKKLDYFSTECIYSPDAYRGHARTFLKDLEAARPSAIIDIIHSGEAFEVREEIKATQKVQRGYHLLLMGNGKRSHHVSHRNMQTMWIYV